MVRVLIVDDAAFMRMNIKGILERNGFIVVGEAGNGIEALSQYKEYKPDIVTMDISMPEMTGIEAVKEIKKYDPQAKIVMVTAMGKENLVMEAIMNGAKSFLVKPFKEEQVVKTLKSLT